MAFEVNLVELSSTGSVLTNLDLSNGGGASKYRLQTPAQPGEPRYKKTKSASPLTKWRKLTYVARDVSETKLTVAIQGSSVDDMQARLNDLDAFIDRLLDNEVARNNSATIYNTYQLWIRPNGATTVSHARITDISLKRPQTFYNAPILGGVVEGFELWIEHQNFSASVYNLYTATARTNGYNNGLAINASTAPFVAGDQAAPLRLKVDGGGTTTDKLIVGVRYADDPALFQHHLWAKDAALSGGTALSGVDTSIEGNNTSIGTITTPVGVTEVLTHRWTITTDILSQYGQFRAWGIGKRSADVFSVRARLGLRDSTGNYIYPISDGYVFPVDQKAVVGATSGNNLALFDLGIWNVPSPFMGRAAVYGLVYELYVTCSSIAGTPTFTFDEVCLFPLMEGGQNTGYVEAQYPIGSGASGIGGVVVDAMDDTIEAYTVNASNVQTFGGTLLVGAGPLAKPKQKGMVYVMLVDATNSRRNHTQALTVTLDYELQHAGGIGV